MLQFSPIFMTPGTWNFTKIKCFNFFQFSWPWVHETSQKSNASIFSNFHKWPRVHETSQKPNVSIFSNFHDPRYMKHHKNQILIFLQSSIGIRILPIPASSPPRLLSSTRFPATCALVGNRATKVRLWEIQISPGYLFIERFPPHLGVF